MPSAASVTVSTAPDHGAGAGSTPSVALQQLTVKPIPVNAAKPIIRNHYQPTFPGGTRLSFGVFWGNSLKGALTFGVGPKNAHRLVEGTSPDDCLCLTRLWLSDELPRNSESRVLGIVIRALRKHTSLKFLVSYADPAQGHVGTIYQASNWLCSGMSYPMEPVSETQRPQLHCGEGVALHAQGRGVARSGAGLC